jgi:hypothetical protein
MIFSLDCTIAEEKHTRQFGVHQMTVLYFESYELLEAVERSSKNVSLLGRHHWKPASFKC